MKNIIKKILLFLFCTASLRCDAQITFQKTYGGAGDDNGYSVQQTTDDGYIICGQINNSAADDDVYLIRLDSAGNQMWAKSCGGTGWESGSSVKQTTDGGFIIGGWGYGGFYLFKADNNGNHIWSKVFGRPWEDYGTSVKQTTDGGYIFTGGTRNSDAYNDDIYLIKTDSIGNVVWRKIYGGSYHEYGDCVIQASDGGYAIIGYSSSFGIGSGDVYLIKTDGNGNISWSKTYGGIGQDRGESILQTSDGGYIIAGYTMDNVGTGGPYHVYLIKTDSIGNLMWSKTYRGTGSEYGYSIAQTTDGGFIITGTTTSFGSGSADVYLIRTDSTGNLLWSKTYGGADIEQGFSVCQTNDGGYVMTGYTRSFGTVAPFGDLYIIKTDSLGNSCGNQSAALTIVTAPITQVTSPITPVASNGTTSVPVTILNNNGDYVTLCNYMPTGINETNSEKNISLFPNPATDELIVSSSEFGVKSIEIYNTLGEKVYTSAGTSQSTAETINVSKLSSGIYFVRVRTSDGMSAGKFVKE